MVTETEYFLLHLGARRWGPCTPCKGKEALKESLQVGVLAFQCPVGHLFSRDLADLPLGHLSEGKLKREIIWWGVSR